MCHIPSFQDNLKKPFKFLGIEGNVVKLDNGFLTLDIPMHPTDIREFAEKHVVGDFVFIYRPDLPDMN